MTQAMNISPEIAHREQALQMEFLRNRVLFLAQSLAIATAERDQALSDRDAQTEIANGLRAELDELRDNLRIESEIQETANGPSE